MSSSDMRRGAMGILLLIVFFDMLAFGVIIPFMPFWAESFGASPAMVAILFATFSFFTVLSSVPWGAASDRWGRKPVLCVGIAGTVVSFAWISQADSLWELFAARALGGLMGGTLTAAQAYIADVTPPEERAGRMGLMGAAIGAGFVLGPAIGYALTLSGGGETDFRTAFLLAAGVGAAGLVAALVLLDEPARRQQTAKGYGGRVRDLAVAAGAPGVLAPMGVMVLLAFCMGGLESTFAMWTERQLAWGVRQNALFFFYVGAILVVVQGALVRPLVRQVGEGPLAGGGALLMAMGFAMVPFVDSAMPAYVGGLLIAAGFGLGQPSLTALISSNAPADQQGAVMGASQSAQSLCRIMGPVTAGLAFTTFDRNAPYLGGAVILLLAFVATLVLMPRLRGRGA